MDTREDTASSAISLHPPTHIILWALQGMSLIVAEWTALNLCLSVPTATMPWHLDAHRRPDLDPHIRL